MGKKILTLALALGFFVMAHSAQASPILREPGAIYLSDLSEKPLRLPLKAPTRATFEATQTRYAGTLRFPQQVEIQAVKGDLFRVRGIAQQGQILGWIPIESVADVPENFVADLELAEERRLIVADLIAQNEVALGMTEQEVGLSLGRPQKTTKRADAQGSEQIWEFVRFQLVPQQTTVIGPGGVATIGTTWVKVPVGTLTVTFTDGLVSALDQTEGNILQGNQVSVVAPPIFVYW